MEDERSRTRRAGGPLRGGGGMIEVFLIQSNEDTYSRTLPGREIKKERHVSSGGRGGGGRGGRGRAKKES